MLATTQELDDVANPTKPARSYVAKGVPYSLIDPSRHGWMAQHAVYGNVPSFIGDGRGNIKQFATEQDAANAAREQVLSDLNLQIHKVNPATRGKKDSKHGTKSPPVRYEKLSGEEFRVLLNEANLDPQSFMYLYGTGPQRMQDWMNSAADIPHPVRILLEIFREFPEAINTARDATESVTSERWPGAVGRRNDAEKLDSEVLAPEYADLVREIKKRLPEAIRVANIWELEPENAERRHPIRIFIRLFDQIEMRKSGLSEEDRIHRLEDIAGALGLGMDVNDWIAEQNRERRADIEHARRVRAARERSIKRSLKPKWEDPWKKEHGLE
jgi:hypothetical protein